MGVLIGTLIKSCLPKDRLCYLQLLTKALILVSVHVVVYMCLQLLGKMCMYVTSFAKLSV